MERRAINIGIIGAGFMGKTHTYNYVNLPIFYDNLPFKINLIGICNRTLSKAEQLKEDFGFELATSEYMDLLERKDIDVIDVCTPNNVHHEQIVNALKSKKHVYADKPLCITDEEADDIVYHAEETGLVHQMAFHNRFYPATLKIKMLLNDGFLGKLISFRATYYHSSSLNPKKALKWKLSREEAGGGVLVDMGSHVLDLLYHYLGEYDKMTMESFIVYPERPDNNGNMVKVDTEEHVLINAKMKNGAVGTIELSKLIAGSNDDLNLEFYGTQGAIRFDSMNSGIVWVYDTREEEIPIGGKRGFKAIETMNKDPESRSNYPGPRFPIGWLRGHIASQYNFLKCIYENKQAIPSFKDGAYIQKVMNKLYSINNSEKWIFIRF